MHNWRLLLLAFLAAFHPIASFTERNLVDGREQCCDRQQQSLFRDTRLSYGTRRLGKPATEDRRLTTNEIREDRRYEVRKDDSLLTRPSNERRLIENRSERDVRQISPELTNRFSRSEFQRARDIVRRQTERRETRRIASRDINRDERSREIARERLTRNSDIRQHGRENREPFYNNRMSQDNSRFARSRSDERLSKTPMDSRRQNRDSSTQSRRIQGFGEMRSVQRADDVARSNAGRNDRHIERESSDNRREFTVRSERGFDDNRERRSMGQRISRERDNERRTLTGRSDVRRQFNERSALDRSERRLSIENIDERRAFTVRSESRLDSNKERRSLDRSERRISKERANEGRSITVRSELMLNDREHRSLDRSISRGSSAERTFVAASQSRLNNNERRMLHQNDRRIVRDRTHERRASTFRPEVRIQLEENSGTLDRRVSRERTNERRAFTVRLESRLESGIDKERRSLSRNDRRVSRERVDERPISEVRFQKERRSLDRDDRIRNREEFREVRQRLTSRREVVKNLERRQLNANSISRETNMAIRPETRDRMLVTKESADRTRSERSATRRDNKYDERQFRDYSRQERATSETRRIESRRMTDRASVDNRETSIERRDRRSVNRLELQDQRRESRSFNDARNRQIPEYRTTQSNVEREESRFRTNSRFTRNRETFISLEKTVNEDQTSTMNWQYIFYTLQGIYLCSVLVQMLSENGSDKKKSRALRWWTVSPQSFVKVD